MAQLILLLGGGSPPLTRGILDVVADVFHPMRFTPAHAGNTVCKIVPAEYSKVHPRSRGEYVTKTALDKMQKGSPPLTRGIRVDLLVKFLCIGFTPAHAGNTLFAAPRALAAWVHPRSRGEYHFAIFVTPDVLGSPPLTRGILLVIYQSTRWIRFTPAHAGNTRYCL